MAVPRSAQAGLTLEGYKQFMGAKANVSPLQCCRSTHEHA